MGIELAGTIGNIGRKMSLGDKGGFNEWTVSAAVSYAVSGSISLRGTLGYTDALDKDVLPDQDVDLFGGISLSRSF